MQDVFSGQRTHIKGRLFPGPAERTAVQNDHRRRLAALARLRTAADECSIRADSDRDLVLLAEDEVGLLEVTGGSWKALGDAIRELRALLPLRRLDDFGFPGEAENPLEERNDRLIRIGGGVEAWVYLSSAEGSVYKFYLPRDPKRIGSEFTFRRGEESRWIADAELGDYRALFEKLLLVDILGMPTEVVAVTLEGVLVAKQGFGDSLPQDQDMSKALPAGLIVIPSRFLRANRDHPRLFFLEQQPYLIADLHARNFVRAEDGLLYPIDLVAAPLPSDFTREPTLVDWLARVKENPHAPLLPAVPDDDL
jgi:hypothetical protein